ncbi:IS66 family insertion sequence element accessory protein TnpB [Bacillus mycoides]|uniref:IS66 family insertion sequence element accessory protein TnpB n=1 Tax=Bacillus mycoides TaxID=1405 RepID=UPI0021CD193E|nr:IS66 family insertion sequence element accessory protein TnpB [Bacillus mycoides]MCU5653182.1 IS66 family insertion sequence element accessory protein TnpB [Bacillus mycoides]
MISEITIKKVYLAQGATDLSKSIDGLAAIVKEEFELDSFSSCLFVFYNRTRGKLKILVWEHNDFWLHYRRLEKGTFYWPTGHSSTPLTISRRQLRWLFDGLAFQQKQGHRSVHARTIL